MCAALSELAFVHQTSTWTVSIVHVGCPLSILLALENYISNVTVNGVLLWTNFPPRWNMKVCGEERAGDSDRWGLSAPSSLCSLWYYMRWQCCHVTGMHPVFPVERSRMLLMLIGSFSQQAPPCAPASNKRPCCLLRLINQTNATGGTKHVCKCTWAFLTCLAVYMAEGFRGVHAFVCVCDWGQTCCMDAASEWPEWTRRLNSAFSPSLLRYLLYVWQLRSGLWWIGLLSL